MEKRYNTPSFEIKVEKSNGVIVRADLPGCVFGTINSDYAHFAPAVVQRWNNYDQLKAENEALKADNVKWYRAYQEALELLQECYGDYSHPHFTDRHQMAPRLKQFIQKHTANTEQVNTKAE